MSRPEIGVYLPQMGFSFDDMLHRTRRCEEVGIDSLWLYDHLYAPGDAGVSLARGLDARHGAAEPNASGSAWDTWFCATSFGIP